MTKNVIVTGLDDKKCVRKDVFPMVGILQQVSYTCPQALIIFIRIRAVDKNGYRYPL